MSFFYALYLAIDFAYIDTFYHSESLYNYFANMLYNIGSICMWVKQAF